MSDKKEVVDYVKLSKDKNKGKLNPFDYKISYADLLKDLKDGKIESYLKDICTKDQIEFIKSELKLVKK